MGHRLLYLIEMTSYKSNSDLVRQRNPWFHLEQNIAAREVYIYRK